MIDLIFSIVGLLLTAMLAFLLHGAHIPRLT